MWRWKRKQCHTRQWKRFQLSLCAPLSFRSFIDRPNWLSGAKKRTTLTVHHSFIAFACVCVREIAQANALWEGRRDSTHTRLAIGESVPRICCTRPRCLFILTGRWLPQMQSCQVAAAEIAELQLQTWLGHPSGANNVLFSRFERVRQIARGTKSQTTNKHKHVCIGVRVCVWACACLKCVNRR